MSFPYTPEMVAEIGRIRQITAELNELRRHEVMWATQEKLYKNAIIQAERDHTLSGGPCDLFFDIHCNPQGASAGSTQIDQLRELHRLQRATMEKPRQDALDAIGKEHYTWVKDHYDPRLMNTRDRMEVHIRRAGEAPEMTSERLERTQREFNE